MLSLFWVLLVVAQPTVNATRDMTLIMLNESRACFMILGSFQVALFLICRFKGHLQRAGQPTRPLRFARSNAYLTRILHKRRADAQLDFGRTTPCPTVQHYNCVHAETCDSSLSNDKMPFGAFWKVSNRSNSCVTIN